MVPNARKRQENERKFDEWEELSDGGRRYLLKVKGRSGWKAIYYKEVDADEQTTRFWQEIFDEDGNLMESHQKYPEDTGHRSVRSF